jgi:hypothetical protein
MKRLMLMAVLVGGLLVASTNVASAGHPPGRGGIGFSISYGNGYSNFGGSYGRGYGYGAGYGGYSPGYYQAPVYSAYPTFAVPVYGGGYRRGGYGGGYYGGHHHHHRHCH